MYTVEQLRKMKDEDLVAEVKNSRDFMTLLNYTAMAIPVNYSRDKFLTQLLDKGGNSPEMRFKVRAIANLPNLMDFFAPPFFAPKAENPDEQEKIDREIKDALDIVKTRGKDWLEDFQAIAKRWVEANPTYF